MSDGITEIEPQGPAEFREWLEANHDTAVAVWVIFWKKASGHPSIDLGAAIDQAMCFGWVDSKVQSLDDNRYRQYFSVRRAGSGWSRINKDNIARLIANGRMTPVGLAAIEQAKQDGSWTILDGPEAGLVPDDLSAALHQAGAREGFDSLTQGARKAILTWIVLAKRDTTRATRVAKTVAATAEGRSPLA